MEFIIHEYGFIRLKTNTWMYCIAYCVMMVTTLVMLILFGLPSKWYAYFSYKIHQGNLKANESQQGPIQSFQLGGC